MFKIMGKHIKSDSGKEKSGYYLTINFEKISAKDPKILLIQMGWLSHADWRGQKSETGQQASITKEARSNKFITLYKHESKNTIVTSK